MEDPEMTEERVRDAAGAPAPERTTRPAEPARAHHEPLAADEDDPEPHIVRGVD
ncbi:hypothetical protein [Streptomyces griseocarneus]|uniref:hypothetical protein n=1 Tax=Streptomyces griseocarneus TaxID=51201 RepID=UPI00167EF8EB|nr:hypothetical protein [Streptomyces griseocarneus]MBZ6477565.1 hypothetical protein [Streptomyces griseocarneus]GHG82464.1 hypothetical protein GCM10018779_65150 [Streptomyces griseocarneus]